MSNGSRRKRKLELMMLASFAIAIVLLILNIFFIFKLGSMQKQINEIKQARVEKQQMAAANAQANGQGGTSEKNADGNETPSPATQQQTAEPEQTAAPEKTDAPEEQQETTPAPLPDENTKYVYLTFDDGPSKNTERILSVLDQYKVKATFFVNGREDAQSIDRYKKIAEAGHEIAMHSYSHDYPKLYASVESFTEDLDKIQSLVERVTGKKPMVYRFPGGSSNTLSARQLPMQSYVDVLASRGIVYFDWNVDTTDGEGPDRPVETLMAGLKATLGKNQHNVVLMHDANDHNTTVDALPDIIQTCIDQGYTFDVITVQTPAVHHTMAK